MKVIYLGSPDFSADFLEKLLCHCEDPELAEGDAAIPSAPFQIIGIVTQPDRPVGRKKILTSTPVKLVAQKHNIPVYEDLNELNNIDFDMGLVFAYSKFIPKQLLDKPKYGFINIHPSLLPLYRGPSPIAYPLINGDKKTGVTIIKLDEKMDHGDVIAQEEIEIGNDMMRPELETSLTNLAFELFKKMCLPREALAKWGHCEEQLQNDATIPLRLVKTTPQDHSQASYTKLLIKEMGFIKYEELKSARLDEGSGPRRRDAKKIYDLYRGLYPWPGIWTKISVKGEEKRMKITELELKDNKLVIKKIQIEGKEETDIIPSF